jgi:hypothetical protein
MAFNLNEKLVVPSLHENNSPQNPSLYSKVKIFPYEKFLGKKFNKMSELFHGKNSEYIPR